VGNKTEMQCALKCSICSTVAIVELQQQIHGRDTSVTVDSTCVFRVAGAAISDVSSYSVFFNVA
jgi:hypothetical protein